MAVWREWGMKQDEHLKNVIAEMEEIAEDEGDGAGEEDQNEQIERRSEL